MHTLRKLKMVAATAAIVATAGVGLLAQPAGAAENWYRHNSSTLTWYKTKMGTNVAIPTRDGKDPNCVLTVWLEQNTSLAGWPVYATGNVVCNFLLKTTVGTTFLKDTYLATNQQWQLTASTTFYNSYAMGTRWLPTTTGFYGCTGYALQGVFEAKLTDSYGHSMYTTYVSTGSPVLPPATQSC